MPWSDAYALAARLPTPLAPERVALNAATGRTLAAPARAVLPAPPFDTAAMDGYAVTGAGPWRVIGQVLAGGPAWSTTLSAGHAVEIATGAVVPGGAEAVLPYEDCQRVDDTVVGKRGSREHIRRLGEDARAGDELAPAGRPVSATLLGAAIQAGLDQLLVHRSPTVCLLLTGDEVILHGTPGPGQVRDALTPVTAALVNRAGGELVDRRLLADGASTLRAGIDAAAADVVAVTGSSSVGAADHLHQVLTELGARWHITGVACRPGGPQALASLPDGRWVVGLPGNPFAGLVGALTILEPLVAALSGRPLRRRPAISVIGDAKPFPKGARLVPVRVEPTRASVIPGARSGSLRAAATADALAVLQPGWASQDTCELLTLP